jgi:hypothetical protein
MKLFLGLDLDFADPDSVSFPDLSTLHVLALRLEAEAILHDIELDEQIAMGWGDTPQNRIPNNWRTRRGPDRAFEEQRKDSVSRSLIGMSLSLPERIERDKSGARLRAMRSKKNQVAQLKSNPHTGISEVKD